jgi:UPF0271 protein
VISDPELAAQRVLEMVRSKAIISSTGTSIPARIDTICLHGDGESALKIARSVRQSLTADGIKVTKV